MSSFRRVRSARAASLSLAALGAVRQHLRRAAVAEVSGRVRLAVGTVSRRSRGRFSDHASAALPVRFEPVPYSTDPDQLRDDDIVCPAHLGDDDYLRQTVTAWIGNGVGLEPCTICGAPGWSVDGILPEIAGGVTKFYENAADSGMLFEDGDFVGSTENTEDALADVGIDGEHPLARAAAEYLGEGPWVPHDHEWPSEYSLLSNAWRAFVSHVSHHSRFLFEVTKTTGWEGLRDELGTLDFLRSLLDEVSKQPVQEFSTDAVLYRARSVSDGERHPNAAADYAPPPARMATQGRMNPAGISYFYGALDPDTAAVEVYAPDSYAAVLDFRPLRTLRLVNLTAVTLPSPFDRGFSADEHHRRLFMHGFVGDISRPIVRDLRIHQEYVPTQAVTEYIRFRSASPVDGVMFKSARAPGTNVVVFANHDECLGRGARPTMTPGATVQLFAYDSPAVSLASTRTLE